MRQGNTHTLSAGLDTLFALGFATGAVVWVNEPHLPHGYVADFFGLRISLLSAAFSVGFAIVWRQCFALLGVYRREGVGLYRLAIHTAGGSVIMSRRA